MNQEQISKVERSIENMKNKTSRIYFLVQDTKGNAKASVSYIYKMAMSLKNAGYNPIILHEKPDYQGVSEWLGEDYMSELPHKPIEGSNLDISPEDLIIIPELYAFVMEQIKNLPCGKVVLCQSYDYIFETLQPGESWSQFGFLKCITTSEKQEEWIETVMRNVSVDVVEPLISDNFKKPEGLPKTIINIHTRDHRDTTNTIKAFYTRFPQYRWFTFRDLRGLSEEQFADRMKESFVSVWVDNNSGYGTFPLESIKMGIPVIGVVPNMVPSWMNENNGIWINNQNLLVDVIADYIQNWLEDNISPELHSEMEKTSNGLVDQENFDKTVVTTFENMISKRLESFTEQLNKLEIVE
jgi:hypothetical protein